eukprot:TRINITY_DN100352_c0_g1_i1.p1 TRINITY_DN100352_c0_g1~~TRINITY_DN100352_c0_g1_i1.p1  ORF type:complete len:162 (-),score=11.38 TRINITY_DN100352_c0_g1_i1:176-661(-)
MGSGASAGRKTIPGDAEFDNLAHRSVEQRQHKHRVEKSFNSVVKSMSKSVLGKLSQHEANSNRAPGAFRASGAGAPPRGSSIRSHFARLDRQIIEYHLAHPRSARMDKHSSGQRHERPSVKLAAKKGGGIHKIIEALDHEIIEDGLKELESRVQKRRVQGL